MTRAAAGVITHKVYSQNTDLFWRHTTSTSTSESSPVTGAHAADAGLLRKREAEVARLLADGLTDKQIGARLFISERTVDSHVRNILNKLGFNTRAQIAAWITTPDP